MTDFSAAPIRLADGTGRYDGRVEIFIDGVWGTVCDADWDKADGRVVCRMLGFGPPIAAHSFLKYPDGKGRKWLIGVFCKGNESSLTDCEHKAPGRSLGYCRYKTTETTLSANVKCSRPGKMFS